VTTDITRFAQALGVRSLSKAQSLAGGLPRSLEENDPPLLYPLPSRTLPCGEESCSLRCVGVFVLIMMLDVVKPSWMSLLHPLEFTNKFVGRAHMFIYFLLVVALPLTTSREPHLT
ncbi:hypothetical protein FOZ62_018948, partial [Perkinsus olseni]